MRENVTLAKNEQARLDVLVSALKISKEWRRPYEKRWDQYYDMVGNVLAEKDDAWLNEYNLPGYDGEATENIVFSTVRIATASASNHRGKMFARPLNAQSAHNAELVELALEAFWERGRIQSGTVRPMVADAVTIGHGWAKTTWQFADEPGEPDPQLVDQIMKVAQDAASSGPAPTRDEVVKRLKQKYTRAIVKDQLEAHRVSPFSMWVDSTGVDMRTINWLSERFYREVDQAEEIYKVKLAASADVRPEITGFRRFWHGVGEAVDSGLAELFELYDITKKQFIVLRGDTMQPISKWESTEGFNEGHPYTFLPCFAVNDHFYPMGFVQHLAPLQRRLDEANSRLMSLLDNSIGRTAIPAELLNDPTVRAALESVEDGTLVPIPADMIERFGGMSNLIIPVRGAPVDINGFGTIRSILIDAANRTTGISDYERGGSLGFRTATEVKQVTGYSNARADEFAELLKEASEDIARRILALVQENLQSSEVLRLEQAIGEGLPEKLKINATSYRTNNQDYKLVSYTGVDLAGEFEIALEAGSTRPQSESDREQRAMAMFQMLMPLAASGMIHLEQLLLQLLKDGFHISNPERFLSGMPADPTAIGGSPSQAGQPGMATGGGQPGAPGSAPGSAGGNVRRIG